VTQRPAIVASSTASVETNAPVAEKASRDKKAGLSFTETKELEKLPAQIESAETKLAALQAALQDTTLYTDVAKQAQLKTITTDNATVEAELAKLYARWELLEEKKASAS
jgi:ABC transport system ATP-binding/permease protein